MYDILVHTIWGPLYATTLVLAGTTFWLKARQKRHGGKLTWRPIDALSITVLMVMLVSFLMGSFGLGMIETIWELAEEPMPHHVMHDAFGYYAGWGLAISGAMAILGWAVFLLVAKLLQRTSVQRQLDEIVASGRQL